MVVVGSIRLFMLVERTKRYSFQEAVTNIDRRQIIGVVVATDGGTVVGAASWSS